MIKNIISVLVNLAFYPLFFLSCMLKKDKNIWIFSSWQGSRFTDNPKAFHEYVITNSTDCGNLRTIWIVKDRPIINDFPNLETYYAYSFWGIYYQCKAGVVIYTDSVAEGFFEHCICPWTFQVQTWHGFPLKKIRNDVYVRKSGVFKFILEFFLPFRYDNPDVIVHTTKKSSSLIANAFGVPESKVYSIGYPRNDTLMASSDYFLELPINFLYAPTYRNRGLDGNMSYEFLQKLGELLGEHGATLDLKLHPADIGRIDPTLLPAEVTILKQKADLTKILGNYHVLISDYSGCLVDYLLLDRRIILYPFDYSEYKVEHGLYSHYDLFLNNLPTAYNELELLDIISETLISAPVRSLDKLKNSFHDNFDNLSSKRLFNVIQSFM